MGFCAFSDQFHMFDITPVENLFIQEFMLKAPGDFVKVYLYGLSQCYHSQGSENSMERFAHALGMELETVENAYRYWERQGIVSIGETETGQLKVEYVNIKDILYNNRMKPQKSLYRYKDFNQSLQMIFESRLLTPQEYLKIYEWIENLHLPEEVVLMMIRFYLTSKGPKISINYLDKVANGWANDKINTLQKAEEYIEKHEAIYGTARAVLKYLGIHRSPSRPELELVRKWIHEWGFSREALISACKDTAKVQHPTFNYLDQVLSRHHQAGAQDPLSIERAVEDRAKKVAGLKETVRRLRMRRASYTPREEELYTHWTREMAFSQDMVLLACDECVRTYASPGFDDLGVTLKQWMTAGVDTTQKAMARLDTQRQQDDELALVLNRAGEQRAIRPVDRKTYATWTEKWKLPFEMILQAAEYALSAKEKIPFIHKILDNWRKDGIENLAAAKQDHERRQSRYSAVEETAVAKKAGFGDFTEREYSDEELEQLIDNR
jgi:DnaD/phage-associated family protein